MYYIGLISGTSVDAIDAALVNFENNHPALLSALNYPIPAEIQHQLLDLVTPGDNELARMNQLDIKLGQLFSEAAMALLKQSNVASDKIHAIGSHGQTLRHFADSTPAGTLQIGDPNVIAEQTGITTVADFRRRDMAAGGQGAPLVPAFHQALFHSNNDNRVVLNIGGIANITVLPKDSNQSVTGFDTGPGNGLMDAWIHQHQGVNYDQNGQWAASGKINSGLLETMLDDPYFKRSPPKSTGRETFNLDWLNTCLQNVTNLAENDVQTTLAELTAISIADAIIRYTPETEQILICGGGVYNQYLIQRIKKHLPIQSIESTNSLGIEPDWVEAMAFAWLAKQTLSGLPGNLPSVTGAKHPVILGGIYPATTNFMPK